MTEQEWRKEFGKRLKVLMVGNKIDQKQLAEISGLTEAAISQYKQHKRLPDAKSLMKLAKALNCTLNDLLWVDDDIK